MVYRGLFPSIFSYCFCIFSKFAKVFEREVCGYKQLICIMQRLHFQVRIGVFNCQDKDLLRHLWYCGKKKIECGLAWCVQLNHIRFVNFHRIPMQTLWSSKTVMSRHLIEPYDIEVSAPPRAEVFFFRCHATLLRDIPGLRAEVKEGFVCKLALWSI